MEKFTPPSTNNNENSVNKNPDSEVMSRRKFLGLGARAITGAALGAAGLAASEDAEAFGTLSVEEYNQEVDKVVVPAEIGDTGEIRQAMKDKYKNLRSGQRRLFSMLIVCNMGGKPHLVGYNRNSGVFEMECK